MRRTSKAYSLIVIIAVILLIAMGWMPSDAFAGLEYEDLNNWTEEGDFRADWEIEPGGRTAVQHYNGSYMYFLSPNSGRNITIQGTILQSDTQFTTNYYGDGDVIGYVFGYQDTNNFYLFQWFGPDSPQDMSLYKVSNGSRTEIDDYDFLEWVKDVTYEVRILYMEDLIRVSIDGTIYLEAVPADASVTSFPEGKYGFYNFSQGAVQYGNVRTAPGSLTEDPPVASDDTYGVDENSSLSADRFSGLLANDYDPNLDDFTITVNGTNLTTTGSSTSFDPGHGSLTVYGDGHFSYTPDTNFTGIDSFTYYLTDNDGISNTASVTFNVMEGNQPPTDIDLSNNQIVHNSPPGTTIGSLITTDPNATDSHDYLLLNNGGGRFGVSGSNLTVANQSLLTEGTYTIEVRSTDLRGAYYDKIFSIFVTDQAPSVANPIADVNVSEDAPDVVIDLTNVFTDPDDDDSAITKTVHSNNNTVLVNASIVGNSLTLDFLDNQSGTALITIRGTSNGKTVNDTFNVTVTAVNDAPSITSCSITPVTAYADGDLSANNSGWNDPEGDSANVLYEWSRNGSPLAAYDGSSTLPASELTKGDVIDLDCTPQDSEGLSGPTLSDSVTISNSPPVAQPDFPNTNEDTPVAVDVLDNDTDVDTGDTITISSVTQGADGTVTNNGTDVTYNPDPNFFGTDSFEYTIKDDDGEADTTTVTVTVSRQTDMKVYGNGQQIYDGDITPSLSDHTDFGTTSLFPGTVIRTFTIENNGLIDLHLTGTPRVEISGAQAGDFSVVTQPSTPLSGGATTTFEIEFDPSGAGLREAEVDIETDDLAVPYEFNIQGTATENDSDGDGMMDNDEQDGDRDLDGVPNYLDYDPTGYFYDERSGEIITGGSVSVTGPGAVSILEDGSNGYYQFVTDGTAGEYILTVNLPPRYQWSSTCLQSDPPAFDPTGLAEPVRLGNGEDGSTGSLTSNACTTFYLTLDLAAGDPFIINNNFPLQARPLPATGFAPGQVTELTAQPPEQRYDESTGFWLEIPSLDVRTSLVGVTAVNGEWDVTWLGNRAGYLVGTAFPTWAGNTVITGHVWNADNQPGVFVDLKTLRYGDRINIHAWGEVYTYQVQINRRVPPDVTKPVFEHMEEDWVTLFTCEEYAEYWGDYGYRRMVQAVLVSVQPEH